MKVYENTCTYRQTNSVFVIFFLFFFPFFKFLFFLSVRLSVYLSFCVTERGPHAEFFCVASFVRFWGGGTEGPFQERREEFLKKRIKTRNRRIDAQMDKSWLTNQKKLGKTDEVKIFVSASVYIFFCSSVCVWERDRKRDQRSFRTCISKMHSCYITGEEGDSQKCVSKNKKYEKISSNTIFFQLISFWCIFS